MLTPEIRRKIRRKNATHAKAKKTGNAKFRTKFETLRREIKADIVKGLASWSKFFFNPSGRKISLVPGKSITI